MVLYLVLFCKCVREFGKVWAFARAEFGMGGTGICPSPVLSEHKVRGLPQHRQYPTNYKQLGSHSDIQKKITLY